MQTQTTAGPRGARTSDEMMRDAAWYPSGTPEHRLRFVICGKLLILLEPAIGLEPMTY